MSAYLGLWSLSAAGLDEAAVARADAASTRALGGSAQQRRRGRLWLAAAETALVERPDALGAAAGFLPLGAAKAVEAAGSPEARAAMPGHYTAARADDDGLTLYRDAGGGERLFWAVRGKALVFSSSARLLSQAVGAGTDAEAALQFLFNGGAVLEYGRTLWSGIRELRAGQALIAREGVELGQEALMSRPADGSPGTAAADLRACLETAVAQALTGRSEAAVALSGGVDSSAIAALACRVVGAGNVTAYTFEFEEPGRVGEAAAAAETCRALGIGRRRVVRVKEAQHREALPEAVWRAEEPGSLRGIVPVLLLSRAAASDGHDRLLTGAGIEALLRVPLERHRYFRALAGLRALSGPRLWTWRARKFPEPGWLDEAARRFGGPALPPDPLYFMVLAVLWRAGRVREMGRFFPPDLRDLARRAAASAAQALDSNREATLEEQLNYRFYVSHVLSMNLQRKVKLSREAGCVLTAPATFAACLAQAGRWSAHTRADAPKRLLIEAMAGLLPDAAAARPKLEDAAVIPDSWARRDIDALAPVWQRQRPALESELGARLDACRRWLPSETARLALWRQICLTGPWGAPPRL